MADIKVKNREKDKIKTLNKSVHTARKIENRLVSTKEKINEIYQNQESSETDYAINKLSTTLSNTPYNIRKVNQYGKNAFKSTKDSIGKNKERIKQITKKRQEKQICKRHIKSKAEVTKNRIKTADKTVRNTQKVVKSTNKITQKTMQAIKKTTKATIHTTKSIIKGTISAIKSIIAGTRALIAAVVAGGWVAILIVIIICLIGLICSSSLGIFFSNENYKGSKTMSSVITEINTDFTNKIIEIQRNNEYDEYEISSNRAEWKDILSVYAILISGGNEQTDLVVLNENKINKLKSVFWEMNKITYKTKEIKKNITVTDSNGNEKIEKKKVKVLYINITNKSVEDMIRKYNFNENQKSQLAELQKVEYNSAWNNVVYGTSKGSKDIVKVALSQLGNVRRTTLLVLVWVYFKSGVVRLFCKLVCRAMWLYRKWCYT